MTAQTSSQHPPPLCFHYHGKPLHVLRHDGQWWLNSHDVLAVIGRRLGQRLLHLLAADTTHPNTPKTEVTKEYWPATALLRALRRSGKPLARQLRDWLNSTLLPALAQLPPTAPQWEQALALAAEAGVQVSHAVLQALLTQDMRWQHSHWLLTLDYTPDHRLRHAHGRLLGLNSKVTPLLALAQQIASPQGLSVDNGELLRLATACHQQLQCRLARATRRDAQLTEMGQHAAAGLARQQSAA
jgi:prophage antirepressor-like protein